jgi:outer membrane protein assembly factor BamE (lipoprotein component of BamABCDE complex)
MTSEAAQTVRRPAGRAKRLLRMAAAGLAVVLAGQTVLLLARTWRNVFPRPGISRKNAERIRCGMSRKEVEAILGGPAGNYWTVATAYILEAKPSLNLEEADFPDSVWKNDEGAVWVDFDSAGRVAGYSDAPNAVFFCETRRVRINPEAYARIKEGMTREEVLLIIGGWVDDYRFGPAVWYPDMPDSLAKMGETMRYTLESRFEAFWQGNEGCIYVEFAKPSETVKSKHYWPGKRRE